MQTGPSWTSSPSCLQLSISPAEVHVWQANLDDTVRDLSLRSDILSEQEQERAKRFYFERDRSRFVAGRILLRTILGRYTTISPSELQFSNGPHGKPVLEGDAASICFNLSHSNDLALIICTSGRQVGVDVEQIRPIPDMEQIAKRFFSKTEVEALSAVAPSERLRSFFACWTRKEAYVKARGDGLSLSLAEFSVSIAHDQPAALLAFQGNDHEVERWSLWDVSPNRAYSSAIAVEGHGWSMICWQVP